MMSTKQASMETYIRLLMHLRSFLKKANIIHRNNLIRKYLGPDGKTKITQTVDFVMQNAELGFVTKICQVLLI
jgi:hypothetical protein